MLSIGALLLTSFLILPTGGAQDRVCPLFTSEHERYGVNTTPKYQQEITEYDVHRLNIGWFLDYTSRPDAPQVEGLSYLPLIPSGSFHPENRPLNIERLHGDVDAHPGAIWILGNEPDRILYQDDQPPEMFAIFYHDAYTAIKQRDPTAKIAFGGIVQPTPIRLLYLDKVLEAYEQRYGRALPVDVWTVHNFVLREVPGSWGADIPPGLEEYADLGIPYGLSDHADMEHFRRQLIDFRQWMADRGYRNKPLLLTEYGILMPPEHGFPNSVVESFMLETFEFLTDARDDQTGYPHDDNRLVQAWSWYSLNDYEFSFETGVGANGNLFDHDTAEIRPLGEAFAAHTAPLVDTYFELALLGIQSPPYVNQGNEPFDVHVHVINTGNQQARNLQVDLWQTDSHGNTQHVGTQHIVTLDSHCQEITKATFAWTPSAAAPTTYTLSAEVRATDDRQNEHKIASAVIHALLPGQQFHQIFVPQAQRE